MLKRKEIINQICERLKIRRNKTGSFFSRRELILLDDWTAKRVENEADDKNENTSGI